MPTETREYSLFSPGSLVKCSQDLYSAAPIDGDNLDNRVAGGTVGVIISGPKPGYEEHYQVQFLRNVVWWVRGHEIHPY